MQDVIERHKAELDEFIFPEMNHKLGVRYFKELDRNWTHVAFTHEPKESEGAMALPARVFRINRYTVFVAMCPDWNQFMSYRETPELVVEVPRIRKAFYGVVVASTDISSTSSLLQKKQQQGSKGTVSKIEYDPLVYINGGVDGYCKAYIPSRTLSPSNCILDLMRQPRVVFVEKMHDSCCFDSCGEMPDMVLLSTFHGRKYPSERLLIRMPWYQERQHRHGSGNDLVVVVGSDLVRFKRFAEYVGASCGFSDYYCGHTPESFAMHDDPALEEFDCPELGVDLKNLLDYELQTNASP